MRRKEKRKVSKSFCVDVKNSEGRQKASGNVVMSFLFGVKFSFHVISPYKV